MISLFMLIFILIFMSFGAWAQVDVSDRLLSEVLPPFNPQKFIPANSEWVNPVSLTSQNGVVLLPALLLRDLDKKINVVVKAQKLKPGKYFWELYPVRGDGDRHLWYAPRYRHPDGKWQWSNDVQIINPWLNEKEWSKVFGPIEKLGLYDKPYFNQCIFTHFQMPMSIISIWPKEERYQMIETLGQSYKIHWREKRPICRLVHAPPVLEGVYRTFVLEVNVLVKGKTTWHWQEGTSLKDMPVEEVPVLNFDSHAVALDESWIERYRQEVKICAGEKEVEVKGAGKTTFLRKNNFQKDHQLKLMLDYYLAQYQSLGISLVHQPFKWQGIDQANMIAIIDGKKSRGKPPIILADHIDTAFSENIYNQTGQRQSNPGADDNCSATAGLLMAAQALIKDREELQNPIWLVHLTGEEFPADDLGARHFISRLLRDDQMVQAVIIMDMIAYVPQKSDRKLFQISAGSGKHAALLAMIIKQASLNNARQFKYLAKGVIRPRFDDRSFLHQTDAVIFSDYGFPVVLINEHLNMHHNWNRAHYHQSSDTTDTLNFNYAKEVLHATIESVRLLGKGELPDMKGQKSP